MIRAMRTELRKLFTVRSTYFILGLVLVLVAFVAFYATGWRIEHLQLLNPNTLANDASGTINFISIFPALIGVLLFTHEYRYNTIMYTLTLAKSRNKVLLAKILVLSGLAIIFTLVFAYISPLLSYLGIQAHHLKLVPQTIHYGSLVWQCLFFGWGYAMAGLVLAALIRNQVGAIITLLIGPNTIEGLLGLLLKKKVVYLPFSSLHEVIGQGQNYNNTITPLRGALVFSCYLAISWAVAWYLFLRRDTN
jgi:ABC-2 type transport system permease protein